MNCTNTPNRRNARKHPKHPQNKSNTKTKNPSSQPRHTQNANSQDTHQKPATTSNNHKTAGHSPDDKGVGGDPLTSTHGRRPRQRPILSPGEIEFEGWVVKVFEVLAVSSTFLGFVLGICGGFGCDWSVFLVRLWCWWCCCLGLCCLYGYELGAAR